MNFASLNSNASLIPNQETFQSYIRTFSSNCGSPECEISHLLRFWSKNKAYLRPHFPDLIVSKQVSFYPPIEREIYQTFFAWGSKWYSTTQKMMNLVKYHDNALEFNYLHSLFTSSVFAANRIPFTYEFPTLGIKVQEGQKLMRVLKQLADLAGVEDFEFLRQDHSRILQKGKIEGELCLSIHPLDYITMSDNSNNWSSCMNWMYEGEFRLGTVEMMNSPYVVVAYLRSPDEEISWTSRGETYHHNSKTWRTLLIVDPDRAIISVKAYPYQHDELTKIAEQFLAETLQWPVSEPYELPNRTYSFGTYAMYNDCGSVPQYVLPIADLPTNEYFNYSGETECMICGKQLFDIYEENCVYTSCMAEQEFCHCACCDDRIPEDDCQITLYDTCVCSYCLESYYCWDDLSDGYIERDDAYEFFYKDHWFITSPNQWGWYKYVTAAKPHYNEEECCYYLTDEDLTPAGLEYFERMI